MVGGLQPPSALGEQEAIKAKGQGVIFVLEEAQLEVAQVGKVRKGVVPWSSPLTTHQPCATRHAASYRCKHACALPVLSLLLPMSVPFNFLILKEPRFPLQGYVLLNCDDHQNFLKKHDKDPALYRPDICHQVLLP